jgi:hypothetical protein
MTVLIGDSRDSGAQRAGGDGRSGIARRRRRGPLVVPTDTDTTTPDDATLWPAEPPTRYHLRLR